MPIVSIGNHQTNVDQDLNINKLLNEINNLIPNEIVVQQYEYETGFFRKRTQKLFTAYYKMYEYEAEQLTGNLSEKETELFLEGLLLAWKNPVRNLKVVK